MFLFFLSKPNWPTFIKHLKEKICDQKQSIVTQKAMNGSHFNCYDAFSFVLQRSLNTSLTQMCPIYQFVAFEIP